MAKKRTTKQQQEPIPIPAHKQPFTADDARVLATLLESYAVLFEEIAKGIDEFPEQQVIVRGGAGTETFTSRVSGLAGNCCKELGYASLEAFRAAMIRRSQASQKRESAD